MKKQAPKHTTATQARGAMGESGQKVTPLRAQVLLAARRRCDDMRDSQPARDQMKREVMDTPAELLADLLTALSTVRVLRADFPTTNPSTTPQE